jgi:hypothetical protein
MMLLFDKKQSSCIFFSFAFSLSCSLCIIIIYSISRLDETEKLTSDKRPWILPEKEQNDILWFFFSSSFFSITRNTNNSDCYSLS